MMKKIICSSILIMNTLTMSIPVNAQEATPEVKQVIQPTEPQLEQRLDPQKEQIIPQVSLVPYSNVNSHNASLSISSSGSVSASAYIAGYPSKTTQIIGYLYLERKIGSSWVSEWSWSANTTSTYLNMNHTCTISNHGTYRLRLSGYVYSQTTYEQITSYSSELTY